MWNRIITLLIVSIVMLSSCSWETQPTTNNTWSTATQQATSDSFDYTDAAIWAAVGYWLSQMGKQNSSSTIIVRGKTIYKPTTKTTAKRKK